MMTDDAVSHAVGTILMVALVIILAMLVLLITFPNLFETGLPSPIQITAVKFYDDQTGRLNYDSRVIIINKGDKILDNIHLRAVFFRNEQQVPAVINTLNGHLFISTIHTGVQWIGGAGSLDGWDPDQMMTIDLADQTFFPGDMVRLEVFEMPGNRIISRSRYRASLPGP
jgi:hypothetical protein